MLSLSLVWILPETQSVGRIFGASRFASAASFHREIMKMSGQWLDVYQESGAHETEAARVRLMDAVRPYNLNGSAQPIVSVVAYSCMRIVQRSPCRHTRDARHF